MLFDARCAGCDRPGLPLCRVCRFALVAPVTPVEGTIVAVPFTGRARDVVLGLKYRNRRAAAAHLGGLLVTRLLQAGLRPAHDVDVVTWVPTSAARRRHRGFDQAELVARVVARQLGLPCRALLERVPGPAQTGRGRHERLAGPGYRARPGLDGKRVLLVDDVTTTGSSLRAAAAALSAAGARRVVRSAVAATPSGSAPARRLVPTGVAA
jgi:predicted amidophosphoribosyltransferase